MTERGDSSPSSFAKASYYANPSYAKAPEDMGFVGYISGLAELGTDGENFKLCGPGINIP